MYSVEYRKPSPNEKSTARENRHRKLKDLYRASRASPLRSALGLACAWRCRVALPSDVALQVRVAILLAELDRDGIGRTSFSSGRRNRKADIRTESLNTPAAQTVLERRRGTV